IVPWSLVNAMHARGVQRKLIFFVVTILLVLAQAITQGRTGLLADAGIFVAYILIVPALTKSKVIVVLLGTIGIAMGFLYRGAIRFGSNVSDISSGRFE